LNLADHRRTSRFGAKQPQLTVEGSPVEPVWLEILVGFYAIDSFTQFIVEKGGKENSRRTTASDLFRRLNSYSKQHGLYQALKAFGQILKSHFILRVIDEPGAASGHREATGSDRARAPLHPGGVGGQSA
jgi:hypothetical protein